MHKAKNTIRVTKWKFHSGCANFKHNTTIYFPWTNHKLAQSVLRSAIPYLVASNNGCFALSLNKWKPDRPYQNSTTRVWLFLASFRWNLAHSKVVSPILDDWSFWVPWGRIELHLHWKPLCLISSHNFWRRQLGKCFFVKLLHSSNILLRI